MNTINYYDDMTAVTLPVVVYLEGSSTHSSWITFQKDGSAFLGGQQFSFHPWKDRSYPEDKEISLSLSEALTMINADKDIRNKRMKEKADKQKRDDIYATYIAALPPVVGGLNIGGGGAVNIGELSDSCGNYCFRIPPKAAAENWSLKKLDNWVKEQTEEMFYE